MSIANTAITSGNNDILVVPTGSRYAITTIMVCNSYDPGGLNPENETSAFDMHLIPSGEGLSNSTTVVVRKLSLPAGETFTFDSEKIVLDEGDRITIVGDANENLAATVSYLEV